MSFDDKILAKEAVSAARRNINGGDENTAYHFAAIDALGAKAEEAEVFRVEPVQHRLVTHNKTLQYYVCICLYRAVKRVSRHAGVGPQTFHSLKEPFLARMLGAELTHLSC